MRLRHLLRDISRFIRFGQTARRNRNRNLKHDRPHAPLSLKPEHIANARLFASRLDYMASLAKGAVCAEVGVQRGDFSVYILDILQPRKLHLIDRDLTRLDVRGRFAGVPNVELHEGLSDRVLCAFPDHYFDWVYIDAGHHYEAVRSDATNAAHKVKPDGLLIFNDYIIWSHLEGCAYGVVTVVNEMCRNEGWEIVAFCLNPEMYCDVALKRRQ